MVILDVSGTEVAVPLDGNSVPLPDHVQDGARISFVRFDLPLDEIRRERIRRVTSLIPSAPEWTTLGELCEAAPDIPWSSLRRIVLGLAESGIVRSTRPKSMRRGQNARRWTRT